MSYQDENARWQAVLLRDPAADGEFYYAVSSTGIYCRPTCPSRRPRRERVSFFATSNAAEQAGFRPCHRCQPNAVSSEQRVVAQVEHLLQTAETRLTLADLGKAVGLSPYHLQRLFKRATGMSPKEYHARCRTERLKAGLREGALVTDALYDAGFGSSRALYDQADQQLGMTPGAYRRGGAGVNIGYATGETALGAVLVAATERGICALRFGEQEDILAELRQEFPNATFTHEPERLAPYTQAVASHVAGQQNRLDLPLDVKATVFQQRVWAALRSIPYGEVRSYTEVAAMIGEPTAVRAVARACATNPVALVVPCHRVVRSTGELSGYRWGVDRKEALLRQERS